MVHDAQLDYYGKMLATCSSDRTVKIFDVIGDNQVHIADLTGHEGPVWQVCWAHPKFGNLLASCSFDRKVIIWKEVQEKVWEKVYVSPSTLHESSVNSICWAPHELNLHLACGSSDGSISIISHKADGGWETSTKGMEKAHLVGCTAVSWAPASPPGSIVSSNATGLVRRLVSAGCDNTVKVWTCREGTNDWRKEELLGHTDWVRDAAWAPNVGLPKNTIASCGQDGNVFIWSESAGEWSKTLLPFNAEKVPVWRVSWSVTGNILAVSDANNQVTLWHEQLDGTWAQVSSVA
ncbi:protein transport protein Sec13 [Cymbomonas tetramitiformis]|uniref:Protein transport protein Sec13 n=1 Tax=Cymbomonas tetramitiformis TaxID=36881 RepID=A0AAE0GZ50_9CHLO|nr:protein transport protein Sec13 [Cymbomonas tetramitiformis]